MKGPRAGAAPDSHAQSAGLPAGRRDASQGPLRRQGASPSFMVPAREEPAARPPRRTARADPLAKDTVSGLGGRSASSQTTCSQVSGEMRKAAKAQGLWRLSPSTQVALGSATLASAPWGDVALPGCSSGGAGQPGLGPVRSSTVQ